MEPFDDIGAFDLWYSGLRHCQRIWHYVKNEKLEIKVDGMPIHAEPAPEYQFAQGVYRGVALPIIHSTLSKPELWDERDWKHLPVFHITYSWVQQGSSLKSLKFYSVSELLNFVRDSVKEKLQEKFSIDSWNKFTTEVLQSVRLGSLTSVARQRFWSHHLSCFEGDSIWEHLLSGKLTSRIWTQLAAFDGHPYHPGSKCKVGLTDEFVLGTAPEFNPEVSILIAAVHASWLVVSSSTSSSVVGQGQRQQLLASLKQDLVKEWEEKLQATGAVPDEYIPVPIHPANLSTVNTRFQTLRSSNMLITDNMPSTVWFPSMSYRTMYQEQQYSALPQWKLPVPVQATSLERYVSPVEAHDSPILTDMLEEILNAEANFNSKLFVMPEPIGVHLNYKNSETFKYEDGRYLSFLLRTQVTQQRGDTMFELPLAGLFSSDEFAAPSAEPQVSDEIPTAQPLMKVPCLVSLLQNVAEVSSPNEVVDYYKRYVDVVLTGQLGIWLRYSIVFEAHQQNCVLLVDKRTGNLCHTLVRDLCGGLCGIKRILEIKGYSQYLHALHERQDYMLEDEDDTYQYVLGAFEHTTLKSHLLPIARVLAAYFGAPTANNEHSVAKEKCDDINSESDLYAELLGVLRSTIEHHLSQRQAEIVEVDPKERQVWETHLQETRKWLLGPTSQFKCLMMMRCLSTKEEFYEEHDNELAKQ